MFEKASRMKLRFNTSKGMLSIEDVWELPLTSNSGRVNLDDIAKELFKQLKESDVVSFVTKKTESDEFIQLSFDIIKHIIEVKLLEREENARIRSNKEKKQQLLALIAQKENEQLGGMSLEELKSMVDKL